MVTHITKENFKEIQDSTLPVVIEVFATWCGPCQHMMPIFQELAEKHKSSYLFASLNVDEEREIAINYNITSVPTFLFLKNNKVVAKEIGYMAKEDLEAKLKELLS